MSQRISNRTASRFPTPKLLAALHKDTFRDNTVNGTHKSLYDYKQSLERACRATYGEHGVDLMKGVLAPADEHALPDATVRTIFDELWAYSGTFTPKTARVTAAGVPNADARKFVYMQIKQRMVTINLHIMNTCFGEAKSEVQNKQPLEPHERLAAIWSALESRYGDIPEQVILDSKQRLEQLMVFKVKDHPDGTATFRKFDTRNDTVDAFFQRLEMVR
eukprot:g6148.t1